MKKALAFLFVIVSMVCYTYGQNVGIGTKNPQSKLHVAGSVRIDDLAGDSGMVLHTRAGVLSTLKFTGKKSDVLRGDGSFAPLAANATAATDPYWTTTGNAGVDTTINFLGTLENVALRFRVNNTPAGALDPFRQNFSYGLFSLSQNKVGERNIAIGLAAMRFNTEGNNNIAIGTGTMAHNTTGGTSIAIGGNALWSNSSGYFNIVIGESAMESNTTGFSNTAIGVRALQKSTTSANHVAVGYESLQKNTSGQNNTVVGFQGLANNTTGSYNSGLGYQALITNTSGSYNTASGYKSLFSNTIGSNNVAVGFKTLELSSTGNNNVAVGNNALHTNQSGSGNTAIGTGANVSVGGLSNATAVGFGAIVNASNKVRIGNASVTVIEGQVPFTTPSDGRFKFNVREDIHGIDFIMKLRPVSYQFDVQQFDHVNNEQYARAEEIRRTGFIAQEVEEAAAQSGFDFSGIVKPGSADDHYGLSYETFVVPLVKAVQEQQKMIESLKKEIEELKQKK